MGSLPFPRRSKADDACAKRGGQRLDGEAVPGLRQRRRGGSLHGPCASCRGGLRRVIPVHKQHAVSLRDLPAAHGPEPGGKTAVTRYRTLETRGELSLLEVELLTGRTHQIRATMADLGCPLLGDGKYGDGRANRRYGETRQALYSYRLTFDFPTDAGLLEYLRGRSFQVDQVPFRDKYFG